MSEKHYCLVKLAESANTLNQIRNQLPKVRALYNKHKDTKKKPEILAELHKLVVNLINTLRSIILLLSEIGDDKLNETAVKMVRACEQFNYLEADYTKLLGALEHFENSLPVDENSINVKALGHLMNRVKMGYFPTDPTHVQMVKAAIHFPEININLLDPCCGCGKALAQLSEGINAVTYGAEIDEVRAEQAQGQLDRVAVGSFFHSVMSHMSFHCAFLNPPYLSVMNENGGNSRLEKTFLAETLPHLMLGGLLIYIVPYYRLTEDVCKVLSSNFEKLTAWRFIDSEFNKFKQVVILGVRKKRTEDLKRAEALFQYCISVNKIKPISELPSGIYTLPEKEKKVDLFKGAVFNIRELETQLEKSKSGKLLFTEGRLEQMEKHPPLPLNVSQIGLVGGSGMMNGLMECDMPHIVKGRIVKQKKTEIIPSSEGSRTEIRVVTSNRMIFNVLTPDDYKSLA